MSPQQVSGLGKGGAYVVPAVDVQVKTGVPEQASPGT